MFKLALTYNRTGPLKAELYGDPDLIDLKHLGKRLKHQILADGVVANE